MKILPVLLMLLAAAGCTSTHQLTGCRGSFVAANPGKWTPTAQDLSK